MKTVRIMLPGNFSGKTFAWKENERPYPEICWRIPELISSLKNQKSFINCVIDIGNNSSVYSPSSYITDGEVDQQLAKLCLPEIRILGPKDLGVFRNKPLSQDIRQRIWTNITQDSGGFLFPPTGTVNRDGFKMKVYSFISKKYVKKFPLVKWGNLQIISPALALKKLIPNFPKDSLTMIVAHLTDIDTAQLISLLNKYKGTFLLVRVAQKMASRLDAIPQIENNIISFKISDGCHQLPIVTLRRRNFGPPRLNVKMVPLTKASKQTVPNLFSVFADDIFNNLNEIVKIIPKNISEPPFRFIPSIHAEFTRDYARSDISIIVKPDSDFQQSLIIRNFNLFKISNNQFIYNFRLKGYKIQELILNLVTKTKKELIFGGCNFRLFAGRIHSFQINGQTLLPDRFYSLSASSEVLNNVALKSLFQNIEYKRNEGIMTWDIWKKKLPGAKINSDSLDN